MEEGLAEEDVLGGAIDALATRAGIEGMCRQHWSQNGQCTNIKKNL